MMGKYVGDGHARVTVILRKILGKRDFTKPRTWTLSDDENRIMENIMEIGIYYEIGSIQRVIKTKAKLIL